VYLTRSLQFAAEGAVLEGREKRAQVTGRCIDPPLDNPYLLKRLDELLLTRQVGEQDRCLTNIRNADRVQSRCRVAGSEEMNSPLLRVEKR
jgi:hypothetical protein